MKIRKSIHIIIFSMGISCLCSCKAFIEGFEESMKRSNYRTNTYGYKPYSIAPIATNSYYRNITATATPSLPSQGYANTSSYTSNFTPSFTPTFTPTFSNPCKPYMDYLDRKMEQIDSGIGVPNYGG